MGSKDKKKNQDVLSDQSEEHEQGDDFDQDEQVDLAEQVENKIKQLPTLKQKVQAIAINSYMIEKRKLDDQLSSQLEAMEVKFRNKFTPFLEEINNIVSGQHQFTDADFQNVGDLLTEQQHQTKHNYFTKQPFPEYWLTIFKNDDRLFENIQEKDQPILKHLMRLQAGKSQDLKTLWVNFYFSQNQWFNNTKLHKEFQLNGQQINKSSGDKIEWKEGKNITVKIVKKKNKKKGGQKKTKQVKQKSFFNFFVDIQVDSDEEGQQQEADQQVQELQNQYSIAEAIYTELLPKSLQFYLGIMTNPEGFGDLQGIDEQDEDQEQEGVSKKKGPSKKKLTN